MYAKIFAVLIAVVVLVSVAAGCGGGDQQGAQSQGSDQEERTGKGKETETFNGTVARVVPDRNTVVVRPEDGGPVSFRYRPENVKVALDGEDAGPEDIEKGQTASVRYVEHTTEKNREVNVARSIELQPRGGDGGEATS